MYRGKWPGDIVSAITLGENNVTEFCITFQVDGRNSMRTFREYVTSRSVPSVS
jgi:hypothetical protein